MPRNNLSPEERLELRRARQQRYREKNADRVRDAARISQRKRRQDPDVRARDKEYKQADKYREKQRTYREENAEKLKEASIKWRDENREKFDAYQDQYRINNRARESSRVRKWESDNADHVKARRTAYDIRTSDQRRVREINRRAKKKASGGKISKELPDRLMRLQGGRCACCRTSLEESGYHLDHIVPLASGGAHADDNIQLLCPHCNISKSAKDPVEFMQSRGFLI